MWGIESLRKAYFLWYAVYCVTVMTVCRVRYGLRLRYAAMAVVTVSMLVVMLTMFLTDGVAAARPCRNRDRMRRFLSLRYDG